MGPRFWAELEATSKHVLVKGAETAHIMSLSFAKIPTDEVAASLLTDATVVEAAASSSSPVQLDPHVVHSHARMLRGYTTAASVRSMPRSGTPHSDGQGMAASRRPSSASVLADAAKLAMQASQASATWADVKDPLATAQHLGAQLDDVRGAIKQWEQMKGFKVCCVCDLFVGALAQASSAHNYAGSLLLPPCEREELARGHACQLEVRRVGRGSSG